MTLDTALASDPDSVITLSVYSRPSQMQSTFVNEMKPFPSGDPKKAQLKDLIKQRQRQLKELEDGEKMPEPGSNRIIAPMVKRRLTAYEEKMIRDTQ